MEQRVFWIFTKQVWLQVLALNSATTFSTIKEIIGIPIAVALVSLLWAIRKEKWWRWSVIRTVSTRGDEVLKTFAYTVFALLAFTGLVFLAAIPKVAYVDYAAIRDARDLAILERDEWKERFRIATISAVSAPPKMAIIPAISFQQFPIMPNIGLMPAPSRSAFPGVEAIVTFQREISFPVLEAKCDRPCDYDIAIAPNEGSKVGETVKISPDTNRVGMVMPALYTKGKQLGIDFRSKDEKPIKLLYLRVSK